MLATQAFHSHCPTCIVKLKEMASLKLTQLCIFFSLFTGFMQFVVLPLFQEWQRFNTTPLSAQMIAHVHRNKDRWERIERGETIESDMMSLPCSSQQAAPRPLRPCAHRDSSSTSTSTDSPMENGVLHHKEGEEEEEEEEDIVVKCHVELAPVENCSSTDSNGNTTVASSVVADRIDPDYDFHALLMRRRHSVPKVLPGVGARGLLFHQTAEPVEAHHRRHSLPMVVALSLSLEKLSEKLAMIAEHSPTNGNRTINLESLHPRIAQLSQSLDVCALERASEAGSHITSAHGLDKLLAQRPFASSPHVYNLQAGGAGPPSFPMDTAINYHPPPVTTATMSLRFPLSMRRASAPYDRQPDVLRLGESDTQPLLTHDENSAPNSGS